MSASTGSLTTRSVAEFVEAVSQQQHAMAGAVIALSAAQASALGQACMQISLPELAPVDEGIAQRVDRVGAIKETLLQWSDRDADAIAEYVALREAGETLAGQRLLCLAPADVGRISLEAAGILQNFRPSVDDRVRDDLEMSISLLGGAAQAALLLLDSNLRIWPDELLLTEFEPIVDELVTGIAALDPAKRIRKKTE